jgi:hypothetical protein
MMAVILSSLTYGFLLLQLAEVPTYLYLLNPPFSTPAVILVPLGVVVGLLSQKHIDRVREVMASNEALYLENQSLRGEHEELRDVNLELAGRVVGAEGTVEQLYEFAKQLNVVDEQKIFEGLLHLLAQALGAERSTIWRLQDSRLEFLACSQEVDPGALQPPDCARYDHLFDDRGVLALHDLPENQRTPNLPFLLGKLRNPRTGQIAAFVAVDTMPFARYNEEAVRLFRMIIDWASTSLGNVNVSEPGPIEIRPIVPAHTVGGFGGEPSIEASLQRIRAMQQAAVVTPTPPNATMQFRSEALEEQKFLDAATVLDPLRFDAMETAAPQRRRQASFVPSVSVMLLSEAGARDPGDMVTVARARRPDSEDTDTMDSPDDDIPPPQGKRGGR